MSNLMPAQECPRLAAALEVKVRVFPADEG
jgi:hypothetical protein